MKITSHRCDNCGFEVYYIDDQGKKNQFPSYIEIDRVTGNKSTLVNVIVCSPECGEDYVWGKCAFGKPRTEDIIKRLQEVLEKKKTAPPVEEKE
jgi:predicted RNA-binding Zn-ribbon protein involved in translation (DUF1610 family)